MTVKNGLPYVLRAVQSILDQSISDWEAIIVDDGSTDGTVDELRSFVGNDPRIKLIQTTGVGRGIALNIAIHEANGDYLLNQDADDISFPSRAERSIQYMKNYPRIGVISSRAKIIQGNQQWSSKVDCQSERPITPVVDFSQALRSGLTISHATACVRREVMIEVSGYRSSLRSQYDYDLWIRIAEAGHGVAKTSETWGVKRIHAGQSFEAKQHFSYFLRSVPLQWRAIWRIKGPLARPLVYLVLRTGWASLPRFIRIKSRKLFRLTNKLANS
jgi:teichuronic acid biosynthesis glycosyltransferase TuaG